MELGSYTNTLMIAMDAYVKHVKFMECQEEFVGYHTRFCKKYARLPVVSSDDSK